MTESRSSIVRPIMSGPEISILIPNYKTPDITRLCMRLLRKHTDPARIHVIAIDNGSADASLDYLRSLTWIDLIERQPEPDDTPSLSHSRALDLAMERVDTPLVLSFHTDTFVLNSRWLDFLIQQIGRSDDIAGVGSWKLESKPWHKRLAKNVERHLQSVWYRFVGRDLSLVEGTAAHRKYLRSHCAMYRTDLLRRYGLTFSADRDTAGRVMHQRLVEAGHRMVFLPSEVLGRYVVHLNHATMVINPELGARKGSIDKGLKRIRRVLEDMGAEAVLADDSLDRP